LRVSTTQNEPKAFAAANVSKSLGFSSDGHPGQSRQLAVGTGGDTVEPALGGGGYMEILGNLEGGRPQADNFQGVVGVV
jgi:hypothetical protein